MPMNPITELLDDLRAGRMIVLVDDEDRENEGDLVFAAESATPEKINFLLAHARGELCLALDASICDQLALPLQTLEPTNRFGTAFTSRSRPRAGVTTGISAKDRATTILAAVNPEARPQDLARPGHVHPLRAQPGGVLVRPGQTEGSVDLCRLAGLRPAAVIMEVLNADGSLARRPELDAFCAAHGIRMGSIADLISYRRRIFSTMSRVMSSTRARTSGDSADSLKSSRASSARRIASNRCRSATTVGIAPRARNQPPNFSTSSATMASASTTSLVRRARFSRTVA